MDIKRDIADATEDYETYIPERYLQKMIDTLNTEDPWLELIIDYRIILDYEAAVKPGRFSDGLPLATSTNAAADDKSAAYENHAMRTSKLLKFRFDSENTNEIISTTESADKSASKRTLHNNTETSEPGKIIKLLSMYKRCF